MEDTPSPPARGTRAAASTKFPEFRRYPEPSALTLELGESVNDEEVAQPQAGTPMIPTSDHVGLAEEDSPISIPTTQVAGLPVEIGHLSTRRHKEVVEFLHSLPTSDSVAKNEMSERKEWLFAEVPYTHSGGHILPCGPFSEIESLVKDIPDLLDLTMPNACLVVFYPEGSKGINLHQDKESAHASEQVISLSIGATATLNLKRNGLKQGKKPTAYSFRRRIADGHFYVLRHQKSFSHGISNTEQAPGGRWALTFRVLHSPSIPVEQELEFSANPARNPKLDLSPASLVSSVSTPPSPIILRPLDSPSPCSSPSPATGRKKPDILDLISEVASSLGKDDAPLEFMASPEGGSVSSSDVSLRLPVISPTALSPSPSPPHEPIVDSPIFKEVDPQSLDMAAHPPFETQCTVCLAAFNTFGELSSHLRSTSCGICCPICDALLESYSALDSHLAETHDCCRSREPASECPENITCIDISQSPSLNPGADTEPTSFPAPLDSCHDVATPISRPEVTKRKSHLELRKVSFKEPSASDICIISPPPSHKHPSPARSTSSADNNARPSSPSDTRHNSSCSRGLDGPLEKVTELVLKNIHGKPKIICSACSHEFRVFHGIEEHFTQPQCKTGQLHCVECPFFFCSKLKDMLRHFCLCHTAPRPSFTTSAPFRPQPAPTAKKTAAPTSRNTISEKDVSDGAAAPIVDRPFDCRDCGKHMTNHHENKDHKRRCRAALKRCPNCSFTTKSQRVLTKHLKTECQQSRKMEAKQRKRVGMTSKSDFLAPLDDLPDSLAEFVEPAQVPKSAPATKKGAAKKSSGRKKESPLEEETHPAPPDAEEKSTTIGDAWGFDDDPVYLAEFEGRPAMTIDIPNKTLTCFFPFPLEASCPVAGCNMNPSSALYWTRIKQSVTKHLIKSHRLDIKSFRHLHQCLICKGAIQGRPRLHDCLGGCAMRAVTPHSTEFVCKLCQRSFNSSTALSNHTMAHRKQRAAEKGKNTSKGPLIPPVSPPRSAPKGNGPSLEDIQNLVEDFKAQSSRAASEEADDKAKKRSNKKQDKPCAAIAPPPPVRVNAKRKKACLDSALSPFVDLFRAIQTENETNPSTAWLRFENLLDDMEAKVLATCNIPERSSQPPRRKTDPPNLDDPATVQRMYRNNRRSTIRQLIDGSNEAPPFSREELSQHFVKDPFRSEIDTSLYTEAGINAAPLPVSMAPFTPQEVLQRLRRFENSAPGPDGITYKNWLTVDPLGVCLCEVFNMCLKTRRTPASWKKSRSILIPKKKGNSRDLSSWRPIVLANTIGKIYSSLLQGRLFSWVEDNEILHPGQKGFRPYDGCIENNAMIRWFLDSARLRRPEGDRKTQHDACVAWLDFRDAFGSVPHKAILLSLAAYGAGEHLIDIIRNSFEDAFTVFNGVDGTTDPIRLSRGIMQGDPLSGLLFNLAIDPVLWAVNPDVNQRSVLAYADDVTPVANSPEELQFLIDRLCSTSAMIGLQLNPQKCASYHLSGRPPTGCRPTIFFVNGAPIRALEDGGFEKYLGCPVGFLHGHFIYSDLTRFQEKALKILESRLTYWQRLDAMKSFIFPALVYAFRLGEYKKTALAKLDDHLRPYLKRLFNLPERATNNFIYAPFSSGGAGLPELAEEADYFAVDTAYKLLTSVDPTASKASFANLKFHTSWRVGREVEPDVAAFLSGSIEGPFADTNNPLSTIWSQARKASRRLGVVWRFNGSVPTIEIGKVKIDFVQRKKVAGTIRNAKKLTIFDQLLACRDQGKTFHSISKSKASFSFYHTGQYCSFKDWRWVFPARLNLLPLNANRHSSSASGNITCRKCRSWDETLPHVLNSCEVNKPMMTIRHNAIVSRLVELLRGEVSILALDKSFAAIPQLRAAHDPEDAVRPDIIFEHSGIVFLVDVAVTFENGLDPFRSAAQRKVDRYAAASSRLSSICSNEVVPFVIGSLGSWDPKNDAFLLRFCTKSYLKVFRELCVSDVRYYSRNIYNVHIGAQSEVQPSAYHPFSRPTLPLPAEEDPPILEAQDPVVAASQDSVPDPDVDDDVLEAIREHPNLSPAHSENMESQETALPPCSDIEEEEIIDSFPSSAPPSPALEQQPSMEPPPVLSPHQEDPSPSPPRDQEDLSPPPEPTKPELMNSSQA